VNAIGAQFRTDDAQWTPVLIAIEGEAAGVLVSLKGRSAAAELALGAEDARELAHQLQMAAASVYLDLASDG
jgi:hypothetical protein